MMAPKYIGAGIPAVKKMKALLEKMHNCALYIKAAVKTVVTEGARG